MNPTKGDFCVTKIVQEHSKTLKSNKIMHLQFLADYEHYQRFSEKITNCTYERNGERLFCEDTCEIIRRLVEENVIIEKGPSAMTFIGPHPDNSLPTEEELSRHELESIETTCEKYMSVDANELKQNTTSLQVFQSTRESNSVL